MSRPNPRVALGVILKATDRADAEETLRRQLARAWQAGHRTGWRDGVDDATKDDGGGYGKATPNPYGSTR